MQPILTAILVRTGGSGQPITATKRSCTVRAPVKVGAEEGVIYSSGIVCAIMAIVRHRRRIIFLV